MKRSDAEFRDCVAIALFFATVVLPALATAGCGFSWDLSLPWCILLAALGGIGAGLLHEKEHRIPAAVAGLVMGVATLLALYYYIVGQFRQREEIATVELYVPFCYGLLPGVALFYGLVWLWPKESRQTLETAK